MPFGDYEDFADCVAKNQDKDNPEAFCAWLEHEITGKWPAEAARIPLVLQLKDAMEKHMGKSADMDATYVPSRNPVREAIHAALDWVKDKVPGIQSTSLLQARKPLAEPTGEGMFVQARFKVCSDDTNEERYVGGLVLVPGTDNAYGDLWEANDIRILAHRFMEKYRAVDLMHTTKNVAIPVESIYFPTSDEGGQDEYTFYGSKVPAGSWWLGCRVTDDQAWEDVKAGRLKGFSLFAVRTKPVEAEAGRGYAADGASPDGKKMSSHEWDVTMVALVDEPAVFKATYVVMRRAPDGYEISDSKGLTFNDKTMGVLRRAAEAINALVAEAERGTKEDRQMRLFKKVDAIEGNAQYQEPEPQPEPKVEPSTELPGGPVQTYVEPPKDEEKEENDSKSLSLEERVAALEKQLMELLQLLQAANVEKVVGEAVDKALQPMRDQFSQMEARYSKLAGKGALPNGDRPDDKSKSTLPSWAKLS